MGPAELREPWWLMAQLFQSCGDRPVQGGRSQGVNLAWERWSDVVFHSLVFRGKWHIEVKLFSQDLEI